MIWTQKLLAIDCVQQGDHHGEGHENELLPTVAIDHI